MKRLFGFLITLTCFLGFSKTEKIFYYVENDSLIGIKNKKGKIILPAQYSLSPDTALDKSEIKDNIIMFWSKKDGQKAYDRKRNFLFTPYIFDNGFDYFEEGFIRFTENKKIGLADQEGRKIIPAKYDWISSVNYGFLSYCNGCYWDTSKDSEHPPLVGGTWGYLDTKGNEIALTDARNHSKDIEIKEHLFLPYQFQYNAKELEILAFFEKRKEQITKINCPNCPKDKLLFEIVEKPTEFNPYYTVKSFELSGNYPRETGYHNDFQTFKVTKDAKNFYVIYFDLIDYGKYSDYIERKTDVDKWIRKSTVNTKKQY